MSFRYEPIPSPRATLTALPLSDNSFIQKSKKSFINILNGDDPRFAIVVGPCSIDNPKAVLDYANKLASLQLEVEGQFLLIMRAYLEKPRTSHGWTGFLNEPNQTFDPQKGIEQSRRLLLAINDLNVPIATEFLSPFTALYMQDLVTWGCIGARTTNSIPHRQLASQLTMPIGFKNTLEGCIASAVNGVKIAALPQAMLGLNPEGYVSLVHTQGNPHCHLVLRGGTFTGPNYDIPSIKQSLHLLEEANLPQKIFIDCSHHNSGKSLKKQIEAFKKVMHYRDRGIGAIFGCMLESYLVAGNQKEPIQYGQSLTDPCLSWDETRKLILDFAKCYA